MESHFFMNEHYLHLLWRTKRLPMHLLRTTDNRPLHITQVGFHNPASGPDFFNGQIELDGLRHSGNIELHVKSSDWYVHGHQSDPAYNNVILHVVYEYDREVLINGTPVPTLELKPLIDEQHFYRTMRMLEKPESIPCSKQLNTIPAPVFWNQAETALIRRLERKSAAISQISVQTSGDPRKVLFHAIAQAFGMKTNALPFQELAQRIPFDRIIKAEKKQVESIVFGTSGLLQERYPDTYRLELQTEWHYQSHRLRILPSQRHSWHYKGCRPAGFPTLRLAQFAAFIDRMEWSESFWELPAKEIRSRLTEALTAEPSDYWKQHYDFGKTHRRPSSAVMSISTTTVILINSVVPFLWWLAEITAQAVYRLKALELLECFPAEDNLILRQWKEFGIRAKSAAESQGLIELKNEFCNRKQCLNCKVGVQVLKQ